jgi:lysophospholipase
MELVSLAKNPVPSGAIAGTFKSSGRVSLRFARWEATRGPARGTMCVFQGRTECIEKYFEVVADLRRRGFAVATMDWRGQGGSDRLLSNPWKGHVRSFADFDRDLAAFMTEVVRPSCRPPFFALAHSMGGNILLRHAGEQGSWFERIVLSAPMIQISDSQLKPGPGFARLYAEAVAGMGLGWLYAAGGSDADVKPTPFENNPLTTDPQRYARNSMIIEAAPNLAIGAPTVGWLRAALRSTARVSAPDYPLKVKVPLLLFAAGMDSLVSTTAIEEFGQRLKVGTHLLLSLARHEILQETDQVRKDFWAAFDAYMGVDAPAA